MQRGRVVLSAMEEVVFGEPAAAALVTELERCGAQRAFLMVSGTLNRNTDQISSITAALGQRCVGVFDQMPPHSPRQAVITASEQARSAGADLIVTIGGGSVTDAAKAVQLCLANDIRTAEAIDRLRSVGGATPPLLPPRVRQISVPTTLSGGEFSAIAGVTNETTRMKERLAHPLVMPRAAILDPAITRHTPEWLLLSTGIRAVDHCVEALCSNETHAYGDAHAAKGLALLSHALPRIKADPDDLDARLEALLGTWLSMGALAAGVPMGASHGIGYVLGAAHGVPHGYTSCVMLPTVLRWNKPANAERQALVAAAMGQAGRDAGDCLDALIRELGLPRSLREVGVGAEHFDQIAIQAMKTPWVPRNPRPIDDPAQIREILDHAA